MKTLVVTILMLTLTFFFGESGFAQQTHNDYVLTGGKHPTMLDATFEFLFVPSTSPAQLGRDRDGYVFELVYDQHGRLVQSKGGEYKSEQLAGEQRIALILEWEHDGLEVGELTRNDYRIVRNSKEKNRIGKSISLNSKSPNRWTQQLIQKMREHNRFAEALLQMNQGISGAITGFSDVYGKKLGL